MRIDKIRSKKNILIYLLSFVVLFALFRYNVGESVAPFWFEQAMPDAEAQVLGRIALGHRETPWARGGMMGAYIDPTHGPYDQIQRQKDVYEGRVGTDKWQPYYSYIGLEGLALSIIDRLLPSDTLDVGFFHSMMAGLSAIVIGAFMLWIFCEFGFGAWAVTAVGVYFSPWLIVLGDNLFWVTGFCFLPMTLSAWWLRRSAGLSGEAARRSTIHFACAYGLAIFVRCACTYEYISTIAMASWVPVVFYALRDKWKFEKFVRTTLLLFFVSIGAFLLTALVHIAQLYFAVTHDLAKALGILVSRAVMRFGVPIAGFESMDEIPPGLSVTLANAIGNYMRGYISGRPLSGDEWIPDHLTFSPPGFWLMPAIAFILTLAILLDRKFAPKIAAQRRPLLALAAATWTGMLCMWSWGVVAITHFWAHYHLLFVLWYMPFAFFFFVLAAQVGQLFWQGLTPEIRRYVLMAASAIVIVVCASHTLRTLHEIASFREDATSVATSNNGIEVLLKKRTIAFYASDCSLIDRSKKFLLRIAPAKGAGVGQTGLTSGLYIMDFDWSVSAPLPLIDDECMEAFDLPSFPIDTIVAGQIDLNSGRPVWVAEIPIDKVLPKEHSVRPKAITDDYFLKGIGRDIPAFEVLNTLVNQISLPPGTVVEFAHSGRRTIQRVLMDKEKIQLIVDKPLAGEEDGSPHLVQILGGVSARADGRR